MSETLAQNIVPLAILKPKPTQRRQRFKITEFQNPSGATVFRVSGYDRNGDQVRENFKEDAAARVRQIELETEYLQGHRETHVRATKLSDDQVRLAEMAIQRLGDDWNRLVDAVDHFVRTGAKNIATDAPRVDEAVDAYLVWLAASTFRDATKRHWRIRMNLFKNSVQNVSVSDVGPEFIEKFLDGRKTSAGGKDTDRRAISRFFSWCIERPRRWATTNPCRDVKVKQAEKGPVVVLTVAECKELLHAADTHKGGILAPYVAVCLFGGLRPFEAARLDWKQVNLADGEIRLERWQSKTGNGRIVKICPTLGAWLKAHKGKPFFPANWRKEFDAVRNTAGLRTWAPDVLRHTAISHYFRQSGSYGFTAEQFGNSEAIIKAHYQGRVSSEDTKGFYAIRPGAK